MTDPNRTQLIHTVEILGEISQELVFIGGSIVGLLITDTGSEPVRATEDVDVIVEVASRLEYERLTNKLQEKGFQPDPNGPICRYIHGKIAMDVMPLDESILGFSNKWYPTAINQYQWLELSPSISLKVVSAPLFIATKLEAYHTRGQADPIMSHDLEDILMVIDGRKELQEEIKAVPFEVQQYLAQEFAVLQQQLFFDDLIAGTFRAARGNMVRQRIMGFSSSYHTEE